MKKFDFVCPNCGSEFTVVERNGVKAKERIEALRAAGVDVSNMFAMQGANGGEHVAAIVNGTLSILDENDPIFQNIMENGTVPNRKLFRRWVTRQVFEQLKMINKYSYNLNTVISFKGYEYQWKMVLDELKAQTKMSGDELMERNLWFNKEVCVSLACDYAEKLIAMYIDAKTRHHQGTPYKRICGENIYVSDFENKIVPALRNMIDMMNSVDCHDLASLYTIVYKFNEARLKFKYNTKMCQKWVDAYKGAGAYFTMQNLIRFHGCVLKDHNGKMLSKHKSLEFLKAVASQNAYKGWWMYGMMKEMINYNNIDIIAKIESWRKK